jgi:hypothetical protein
MVEAVKVKLEADLQVVQKKIEKIEKRRPENYFPGGGGGGTPVAIQGNTGGVSALISTGTLYLVGQDNIVLNQTGNSIGISANAGPGGGDGFNRIAAGTQTAGSATTVVFANSNGISFGMDGSSRVTASYTVPNVPAQTEYVFSNSNNVSFGTNGSTVTATATFNQSVQTQNMVSVLGSTGNISFVNANGVTFGGNNSTITATVRTDYAESNHSHGNPSLALTNLSGTTASNSNGFTLSLSAAAGGGGADGYNILAAGTQTATTAGSVLFQNSNGITFGMSDSSVITASHNGLTSQSNQAFSAEGGSSAFQTLVFTNSNGVSFSNSNGSVVGSVATTYAGSDHSHGNPTLALTNLSGTTASNSNGLTLSLSAAAGGGGAADGYNILAAGTQTANTTGTVLFSNANGISFGMSDSSRITASYTVPSIAGLISAINVSAGTTSNNLSALTFSNSNGISFGLNGSVITASHNALTSQSNQAFSANGGSSAFQTLNFVNGNGATFTNNAGSVGISYTVPTVTNSSWTVSDNGTSGTVARLAFTNLNGVTLSLSTGAGGLHTIVGSHNALTTAALSNHSHGNPTLNLTNLSGTTASNSAGFTLSLSAADPGGGVTPVASASNGSFSFTTLAFSNANNVTFGTSAGSIITASVAPPDAAAEANWINLLGANTAGNTTASGSTIGLSGINMTLSGTNGSRVVMSVPAVSSLSATGQVSIETNGSTISIGVPNRVTMSGYNAHLLDREWLAAQIGQNTIFIQPLDLIDPIQFNQFQWPNNFSNATNSSNSATLTLQVGIYTRNGNSLSRLSSTSSTYSVEASGTVGSYSIYGGVRHYPIGWTGTLTDGNYWLAFRSQTTTGGGAGMTWSNFVASNIGSALSGVWGSSTNASNQFALGLGSYSATSTALPVSIAFTEIRGSAAGNLRPVIYQFVSGSV